MPNVHFQNFRVQKKKIQGLTTADCSPADWPLFLNLDNLSTNIRFKETKFTKKKLLFFGGFSVTSNHMRENGYSLILLCHWHRDYHVCLIVVLGHGGGNVPIGQQGSLGSGLKCSNRPCLAKRQHLWYKKKNQWELVRLVLFSSQNSVFFVLQYFPEKNFIWTCTGADLEIQTNSMQRAFCKLPKCMIEVKVYA